MNPQFQFMLQQAAESFQGGNLIRADSILKRIIQADSNNFHALNMLGLVQASFGKFHEAVEFFKMAAKLKPNDPIILFNLAKAFADIGQHEESIPHYKKAVRLAPNNAEGWVNFGQSLANLKHFEDALECFNKAIEMRQNYYEAILSKCLTLNFLGFFEESLSLAKSTLALNPSWGAIWLTKGNALKFLKLYKEALESYEQALAINPNYAEVWLNKGTTLQEMKLYKEALESYEQALAINPNYAEVWLNKGTTLQEMKLYKEALESYEQALAINPNYAEVWLNKGTTLQEMKLYKEALESYEQALAINPNYAEVWLNKGEVFNNLREYQQSANSFFRASELSHNGFYALGKGHHRMMLGCDWTNYAELTNQIFTLVAEGRSVAEPFGLQGICESEALARQCAEIYSSREFPAQNIEVPISLNEHSKIRIGYLCGEFREQATTILLSRVWELHDPHKYEIFAFDNGWSDDSDYRLRAKNSFIEIVDITKLSDSEAANLVQEYEIDILVNLNGFFGLARQGIFSYRAAPVQVNFLGFPGTLGAPYIDYIIADKIVLPLESAKYYSEKIAYLPNSYQPNDDQRKIAHKKFTKSEFGLPDSGFVFCCFNNTYKITPPTFDLWCEILKGAPGSVLWLLDDNLIAKENLIAEAAKRQIASERLIFAKRLPPGEHLARQKLADLFLDTCPYNAHTTASDALWAGLPILTLMGSTFPGRVSASLLAAIGLPELVTHTKCEYVETAIALSQDRDRLQKIKIKLIENKLTKPLFNSVSYTKYLEKAYGEMYRTAGLGLQPQDIFVDI